MPLHILDKINPALAVMIRSLMFIIILAVSWILGFGCIAFYKNTRNPFYGKTLTDFYIPDEHGLPLIWNPPLIVAAGGEQTPTGRLICSSREVHAVAIKDITGLKNQQVPLGQAANDRIVDKGCWPRTAPGIIPKDVEAGFYWYSLHFVVDQPSPMVPMIVHFAPVLVYVNEAGSPTLTIQQATALMKAHPELVPKKPPQ